MKRINAAIVGLAVLTSFGAFAGEDAAAAPAPKAEKKAPAKASAKKKATKKAATPAPAAGDQKKAE